MFEEVARLRIASSAELDDPPESSATRGRFVRMQEGVPVIGLIEFIKTLTHVGMSEVETANTQLFRVKPDFASSINCLSTPADER